MDLLDTLETKENLQNTTFLVLEGTFLISSRVISYTTRGGLDVVFPSIKPASVPIIVPQAQVTWRIISVQRGNRLWNVECLLSSKVTQ